VAQQQPLYGANANVDGAQQRQQRMQEVFDVNERLRHNDVARQRLTDGRGVRVNEWGGGVVGCASCRTRISSSCGR
jgi:hypothetical protein